MTPQETESKPPASAGGLPVEVWVSRGSPQGRGHWKVPLGINPLGVHHQPYYRAPGMGILRLNNYHGGSTTPPTSR